MRYEQRRLPRVMCIGGSDSGSGAGIQADLKAVSAREVYCTTVLTAVTAQNTQGVEAVAPLSCKLVGQQIDAVMKDIGADVWKMGMLMSPDILDVVREKALEYKVACVVFDPVMISTSGHSLFLSESILEAFSSLLPIATVVTPNIPEAEMFTQQKISTLDDMRRSSQELIRKGAKAVLLKGGHLPEEENATDLFFDGSEFQLFTSPRIKTQNTHGTGCSFASTLAAELAKGRSLKNAIVVAKRCITLAIQGAIDMRIGRGHGPLDHFHWFKELR